MHTFQLTPQVLAAWLLASSAMSGALAAEPATETYGPGAWYFQEPKVFGPDSVLELQIIGIGGGPCSPCSPTLVFEQGVHYDGTLRVTMAPSWFVYASQGYTLFSVWTALPTGRFHTIELPQLDPSLGWNTDSLYSNGSIMAQSPVPEPAGWLLGLAGLGVLAGLARQRHIRTA